MTEKKESKPRKGRGSINKMGRKEVEVLGRSRGGKTWKIKI